MLQQQHIGQSCRATMSGIWGRGATWGQAKFWEGEHSLSIPSSVETSLAAVPVCRWPRDLSVAILPAVIGGAIWMLSSNHHDWYSSCWIIMSFLIDKQTATYWYCSTLSIWSQKGVIITNLTVSSHVTTCHLNWIIPTSLILATS